VGVDERTEAIKDRTGVASAPVMVLAMVEAGHTVLLGRLGTKQGTVRDSGPVGPVGAGPVAYSVVAAADDAVAGHQLPGPRSTPNWGCGARWRLRRHHGHGWRRRAPGDVVWTLRTGVGIDAALAAHRWCRRPISAETLRKRLHVGAVTSRA
jgi:lysozyme family protein